MQNGFIKVAAGTPTLEVANCNYNAQQIIVLAKQASKLAVHLLVTPELALTAYTCGDLLQQQTLLQSAEDALQEICAQTSKLSLLLVVGLPLRHNGKLYNCAALLHKGNVLGFVPKTHLPGYAEFHEFRHFAPADGTTTSFSSASGIFQNIPFGTQLLFRCSQLPSFTLGIEICEDLWAPLPPSTAHALAGATVIANASASNEIVGKAAYRRTLVGGQSARLLCGYIYANAGSGESTTDLVFSGHNLIAENGQILAENPPFGTALIITELDCERLEQERRKQTSFGATNNPAYTVIPFSLPVVATTLTRVVPSSPFVAHQAGQLAENCETILTVQAAGLCKRMQHTHAKTALLGVSGGLDSALALLVIVRAFAMMNRNSKDILAVTMPGFGTTNRTRANAEVLCSKLGVTLQTIDITKTARSHFEDIQHDENNHDVVFENVQARIRTLVLMNLANQRNGLVIGTGDLSELALGWATYNGDHMSMYSVNASVPKTLIRSLIIHEAAQNKAATEVLTDILNTPVSPELLPAKNGEISQQTEALVGPYQLHDFFLYYVLRYGFTPGKIFRLAKTAFGKQYSAATLLTWLKTFYTRFFSQQFKRSCLPDGPKVGSVNFSPRGDWRMPSDASAAAWMQEIEQLSTTFK